MSDESSLGSPRMKTPDLKAKPRGQMPWWAEEEDDDDRKKTEAVRQSWLKPKTSIMVLRQKRQHKMLLDSKDSHVLLTIIKIYLK